MYLYMYIYIYIYIYIYMCVCVCVFIHFHCKSFFVCNNVSDILEGTDQRSCVEC